MSTSDKQLNNEPTMDEVTSAQVEPEVDGDILHTDGGIETTAPLAPSTPLTKSIEPNPLEGFNPDDYKNGVEGDERYRILDLYLGFLVGEYEYDLLKIRSQLVLWDEHNRPPIGIMAIHAYIKANLTRWAHYHFIHKTGTWQHLRR